MDKLERYIEIAHKTFPNSRIKEFTPYFKEMLPYAGVTNDARFAMYLAQLGYESAYWTKFEENLNYSEKRLTEVWSSRFRLVRGGDDISKPVFADGKRNPRYYAGNPKRLANYVYANRLGNGDEASGDGYKYRGMSPIQLTGKELYQEFDRKNGLFSENFVEKPELLLIPKYGLAAASYYWGSRKLNTRADTLNADKVTEIINKNTTQKSYRDRKALFEKIYKAIAP